MLSIASIIGALGGRETRLDKGLGCGQARAMVHAPRAEHTLEYASREQQGRRRNVIVIVIRLRITIRYDRRATVIVMDRNAPHLSPHTRYG